MMYPNWLLQRTLLTGERLALSYGDRAWTFAELNTEALETAGRLAAQGVRKGSRVAVLSASHPEFVRFLYACLHVGCEVVMLNERLTAAELAYQLEDSAADFVFADDALAGKLPDALPLLFSELAKIEAVDFTPEVEWETGRTLSIMYTSGTTGYPKGVRQTAENHFSSAVSSALNLGITPEDTWLCTVPLYHISGFSILMRSLVYGMGVRLHPKFEAAACAEELHKGTVTHMSVVGVTLERLLHELESKELSVSDRFRAMLAGGGPVPVSYIERAEQFGIAVLQTYGMTETSSQSTTLQPADAARKIGSSGKPLFLYQVKIEGAIEPGDTGEILIRGPQVTPGYIGSFSERPSQQDGWLHTGDIGYLDVEGFLFVIDRRSDLIVSGGENVYPAEIEKVLAAHPAVQEAGVCGMKDDKWGEVPAAFVVLKSDVSTDELHAFCKERLASYKVPKTFAIVDSLPRNALNKLLRRTLKTWL
ncbi:o-succinylbenzoate--CoA ligase [Planomicrobium sp. YIM 101495]|uniref:o-succinylbenzoate--CoA ligase n=1 Tax=Planomicrobium sp. YIM 101495 TaxID=2665160 RepID=UPI0012B7F063|nr:o-succinylbenzoate--CoA ligase [Planomicrobium sp. YIM 101495]MTD29446.1 o-succinylbenzoate--CoA ligase [Planomicrobium sp. YIM 101495]